MTVFKVIYRALFVDHNAFALDGVQNLRIADASIFPTLISGNTNAAAIMVGEKAADLILSDSSDFRFNNHN